MNDNPQRVDEFKSAIADLKLRDPSTRSERQWLVLGIVCMVAAIAVGVYCALQARQENDIRDQTDLLILALAAIIVALVGIALFLRYSFGRLMRFWLVRVVYEMRATTGDVPSASPSASPSTASAPSGVVSSPPGDQTTSVT